MNYALLWSIVWLVWSAVVLFAWPDEEAAWAVALIASTVWLAADWIVQEVRKR